MITTLLHCQCDSIVTKTFETLISVVRELYEAGTSCYDVTITNVICKSLVIIVAIGVAGFLAWKIIDHNTSENEREFKKRKEKEESERKQKAELLSKLLDFQKELAFPYEKNKEGGYVRKNYDSAACEKYQNTLIAILNGSKLEEIKLAGSHSTNQQQETHENEKS